MKPLFSKILVTYDSRGNQCSSPFDPWLGIKYGLATFLVGLSGSLFPVWATDSPKFMNFRASPSTPATVSIATRLEARMLMGHGAQIMFTLSSTLMALGQELSLSEQGFLRKNAFNSSPQRSLPLMTAQRRVPPANSAPGRTTSRLIQGGQVLLNGRSRPLAWIQWQVGNTLRWGLSDVMASQQLGLELLSSRNPALQPVQWYGVQGRSQFNLAANPSGTHRYLDVTDWVKLNGWQMQTQGDRLVINTPLGQMTDLRQEGRQGHRMILTLNGPVPWQLSQTPQEWVLTLEAATSAQILDRFQPQPTPVPSPLPPLPGDVNEGEGGPPPLPTPTVLPLRVESSGNQTKIRAATVSGLAPRVLFTGQGNRLVVELQREALPNREIQWTNSIRWRQQYLTLDQSRFPAVWLTLTPKRGTRPGVMLRPIWATPNSMTGTSPLMTIAPLWQATAAINGGFFNRNNQLPLGAVRRDGQWQSGPILNRGAIAWNDQGQMIMGRLSLIENLILPTGQRLPIALLNTAYVQPGIARYTPRWGNSYTPLSNNERVVIVRQNQVVSQIPNLMAGQEAIPIPSDGYLLVFRVQTALADVLVPGIVLGLESATTPIDFNQYPHTLGAGPLLIQNRRIVLDAKAEGFGDAFARQSAIRSVIATNAQGEILLITIHPRIGGSGPTLAETARLIQQLGVVNALNLDGGSSTSLYLGGQLIDRSPVTAARVHNGLGIFWQP